MPQADSKVESLRALPLFAGVGTRDLERVAALCDWATAAQGSVLTAEGRAGLEFFLIVSGAAEVQVGGEVVGRMGPGECFGELALLDHGIPRRHATVVATEPMGMYVFEARGFASLLDAMPAVAQRIRDLGTTRQQHDAQRA
jgi:CRP/FNR family transcriptional regulator, cyclic AMP receptor protein